MCIRMTWEQKKWWKPTKKCRRSAIFHPLAWIAVLKLQMSLLCSVLGGFELLCKPVEPLMCSSLCSGLTCSGPTCGLVGLDCGPELALFGWFSSLFLSFFFVFPSCTYTLVANSEKIGLSLLLADARASERKFLTPTGLPSWWWGVPTTNSTNKYPNVKQLSWAINYCAWHILAHVHGRSRRTRAWQWHARARGHTTRMRVAILRACAWLLTAQVYYWQSCVPDSY